MIRTADGNIRKLSPDDYDFINTFCDFLSSFYPKAYAALCEEYNQSALNQPYFRFRVVSRFIRCNFAALDDVADISTSLHCNFEYVQCPMRGECRLDHVVCRPEFNHRLSRSELQVMRLVYEGLTEDEIGDRLRLSPHTIHAHVRNAYSRLNIHSKAEFIKYAADNSLF
ncbi:MAG: helix-turn-helix transcriptional regulator [Muribaculaceae bacterium]|nr:helix-turn-helix transcriptional regulator [Muribaculaceae bacterium]